MRFRCPTCKHDHGGLFVYRDASDSRLEFGLRYEETGRVYLAANLSNGRRNEHAEIYDVSSFWLKEVADWAQGKGVL